MSLKLFGGIAIGAVIGGGVTYAFYRNKHKTAETENARFNEEYAHKMNDIVSNLREENNKNIVKQQNTSAICDSILQSFHRFTDIDMIADIANIGDIEYRDRCFAEIEGATTDIEKLCNILDDNLLNSEKIADIRAKINLRIEKMCSEIKDIINICEDDDDDDDQLDENNVTISPKKIILNSIGGTSMVFDADPDDGFEVLDGSDVENNDYCFVAQNVPKLYNILFNSIRTQLAEHYVLKIDPDAFDMILEDMVITVSVSFINDTDVVVTAVNAVVPFEIFGITTSDKNFKIYSIQEGEITNDVIIRYFRSINSNDDIQNQQKNSNESCIKTETVIKSTETPIDYDKLDVSLSDENIQFIINTIGFSRESLKAFFTKLNILCRVNPEAGGAIKEAFEYILRDIHSKKVNNQLNDDTKLHLANSLRALILNMKKNYGAEIKSAQYT